MNIITVINQKGGVGKTTTTINIAVELALWKYKVLAIDLDPQGNLSTSIGIDYSNRSNNAYELLNNNCNVQDAIIKTNIQNLSIITSNIDLSAFPIDFSSHPKRDFILKDKLQLLKNNFDFVIIDCPPSLNLLSINALTASHNIIIPIQCEFLSLEGLSSLIQTVNLMQKNYNKNLKIMGILLTMYDKRNKLSEIVANDVISCLGDITFNTIIPRNVRISEAPSHGQAVVTYDSKSSGAIAYKNLVKEILCTKKD